MGDFVRLEVTGAFIRDHLGMPAWTTLKFGLDHDLLSPSAFSDLASAVGPETPGGDGYRQLASAPNREARSSLLNEFVERGWLTGGDPEDEWLYLSLAWAYEHRDSFDDPLEMAEFIFAEFGYPDEVEPFIRYMPPRPGKPVTNTEGLIRRWGEYLEHKRASLPRARPAQH